MRFTLLGARGFVGRHLLTYLTSLGHEVIAPARDARLTEACHGTHVIYAIGLTADFRQRPFDTIEAHVSLAAELLRDCDFTSFLYLSSTRVYAGSTNTDELAALTVRPGNPSDLYNLSKLSGEAICNASGRPNVRIARLSNVVGPASATSESFIGDLCREAAAGHITLRSSMASAKDYIWIDDAVKLLTQIAENGQETIYNVASGQQTSNADWVTGLARHTGCRVDVADHAPTITFPPIDIDRIRAEFAFKPERVIDRIADILSFAP
ncbi:MULTISPECIES: SDR family oxidoreductase [Ensifer]|uniref:NAD-dependent epimerase/dehydratase family protein n=1 Tax=Ensifer canadensis TaxID=555315 RepID=A0AAW4FHG3_9HYPH|nr:MULTISPECIES: SDR family oxidoreductase [Ensifer]AHK45163.1 hypothetical protein OV14_3955 [Ensifer adhaerens OV14]MDP9630112.1 nucleoside-diphosphate-sugar epimerase [Ensifer adhaerens]KQU94527.1 NAD-dependent dehydratase [Ensifer sp. Root31]KQW46123.1 NAD-dependent dehydratase [Ensifer sp. Root1252]KQW83432.1 NAD-dependent dehydratase [Ensifer sp. Root127]